MKGSFFRNRGSLGVIIFVSVFFAMSVSAEIPKTMNYQGFLTDSGGTPVNSSVSMQFSIYDEESGTNTALWTETQTVSVANGHYDVILGSTNPLELPFDEQYFLGIAVGGDTEMIPRKPFSSSPYALNSEIIEINSLNYETVSVSDDKLVNITEIINLTDQFNNFHFKHRLRIHGGGFKGTGNELIYDLGDKTIFTGVSFDNIRFSSCCQTTIFVNCTFKNNIEFPLGATLINCFLENVISNNGDIVIRNSKIENSIIGSEEHCLTSCVNNIITGSKIFFGYELNGAAYNEGSSIFSNNRCKYTSIFVPGNVSGDIVISDNSFYSIFHENGTPIDNGIIYIEPQIDSRRSYTIDNNTFYGGDPSIFLNSLPSPQSFYTKSQTFKISNNMFVGGLQAISYSDSGSFFRTLISDNLFRDTPIGVSTSGNLKVMDNNWSF